MRSLVVGILIMISNQVLAYNQNSELTHSMLSGRSQTQTLSNQLSSINAYFNVDLFYQQAELTIPLFNDKQEFTFFSQQPFEQTNDIIASNYYHKVIFTHNKSLFKPELFQAEDGNQVSLHYLHLGQNIPLTAAQTTWLYSGAGFTYFNSESGSYQNNMALSFSVGIHSQYKVNNRFSINFDSKLYGTYFDGDNHHYCVNDTCQLHVENDVWLQKQMSIKVKFVF